MKAKMQTAADAASIAALSQKSPGFIAASAMTGDGSVAAGVTDATNVFDANMSAITGYQTRSQQHHDEDRHQAGGHRNVHRRCPGDLPGGDGLKS